jgi:hypothetical protein
MTQNLLNTPWRLFFDRDGTEDFGIICDAAGNDIAASHLPSTRIGERTFETGTCWLPESDEEEPPVLVRQLQVMTASPQLLAALKSLLDATGGLPISLLSGRFYDVFHEARVAISVAERRPL